MSEEKRPPQVFISYSRRDLAFVEQLAVDLKAAGLDVWYDLSGLKGGARWRIEIEKAIRESQYALIVLSPDSVVSEWVEEEILYAKNLNLKIIPLLYRQCDLPLGYQTRHYIDVQEINYNRNFDELLRALGVKLVVAGKIREKSQTNGRDSQSKTTNAQPNWVKGIIVFFVLIGLILAAVFGIPPLFSQQKNVPEPTITFSPEPSSTPTESIVPTATPLPTEITDSFGVYMVLVPAGEFSMGSDEGEADEQPAHTVKLDTYYIDKYEVTNAHYKNCVLEDYCQSPQNTISYTRSSYYDNSEFNNYPVIYVDWFMANTFCEWRGARLPTEAEWEKAARDDDGRIYPWGDDFDCKKGNFDDETKYDPDTVSNGAICDGYTDTAPVGSFPLGVSPYGAFDMAGNVREWVSDWYSDSYYSLLVENNPTGPSTGEYRSVRSGSWLSNENILRSLNRGRYEPLNADFHIGFRCAKDVTP